MSKIALITDTHMGCRAESPLFNEHFISFFEKTFFPYIEKNNIRDVIHLGDLADRRKYINFSILDSWKKRVFDPLYKLTDRVDILLGNHCTYAKNTNDINSPKLLLSKYDDKFHVFETATEIFLDKLKVLYVPWIASDIAESTMKLIESTNATVCMGHLEISGFQMFPGQPAQHGLSAKTFEKFHSTFSGHFHLKSSANDIHYLGSPYHMIWSDYDTPRGFHVFDTDTLELEFIENKEQIFKKVYYDDIGSTSDLNKSELENKIVKVIVKNKSDSEKFDSYIKNLQECSVSDVAVIDEFLDADIISASFDDSSVNVKDTLSVLKDCVDSIQRVDVDKAQVLSILQEIYVESINQDTNAGI